jgi:hypothetical protein
MSGDWIKMRTNLDTDPRVLEIATKLGVTELHVVGMLWKVWAWADAHTVDGNAIRVTDVTLDRFTCVTGFANQMRNVGWLQGKDGALCLPNFTEHNGQTAKKRANTSKRVAKHRNAPSVTDVTPKALPEKRREEKSINKYIETPKAARCFSDSFFDGIWAKWRKHRSEKLKPLGDIEEETQLMDLSRHGEPEAIEMVDFSIRCGALNLITNGNHKKQIPTGSSQTSQSRSRFSLKDIPV